MKTISAAGLALGAAMLLSGHAAADDAIKVELWNKSDGTQGITIDKAEVAAGKVTFEVTNSSTNLEHEFMLVKTDMTSDQLPVKDDGAKVDEGKLQGFEEFGDVEAGDTKTWDTEMAAGKYILFCNEEGHFKAGMYATLTVTP